MGKPNSLEGGDGEDESLEGAVLDTVPDSGSVLGGLHGVKLLDLLGSEAKEIGELREERKFSEGFLRRSRKATHLSGGINLGLPGVLSLSEHGSSADLGAVLAGDEVGGLRKRDEWVSVRSR